MFLVAVSHDDRSQSASVEIDDLPVKIGRDPKLQPGETAELLRIWWNDRLINRNHSFARRDGESLVVERLQALPGRSEPNAFYENRLNVTRQKIEDPVRLRPGESLTIGSSGRTGFYWLKSLDDLDAAIARQEEPPPIEPSAPETVSSAALRYDQVEQLDEYALRLQLKLLQQELPQQVLSGWTDEEDLLVRAATFLENALPGQKGVTAAFLALEQGEDSIDYVLLNPDPNMRADFRPSRTLLKELDLAAPDATDVRLWTSEDNAQAFTSDSLSRQVDWVAAIPVAQLQVNAPMHRDSEGRPVYLYVETRQSTSNVAASFVPFLRLITSLVASLLAAREKQRVQDQLSSYFSPALREIIQEGDQTVLEPTMAQCTVLFCDRRASSQLMEQAETDEEILDQLRENQEVVGEISQIIFDYNGVITDFAGDGVLALWGWPAHLPGARDHAGRALAAARAISEKLAPRMQSGVSPIRIGISTGRIAVGKTGPTQQLHISVFGSVVNLGARLETMAKQFRVPALLSEETVSSLKKKKDRPLLRKLCYLKPAGFTGSYAVYELVLPKACGGSGAPAQDIATYERALEFFVQRQWTECQNLLEILPPDDAPSLWLSTQAALFQASEPGADWEGEIASFLK